MPAPASSSATTAVKSGAGGGGGGQDPSPPPPSAPPAGKSGAGGWTKRRHLLGALWRTVTPHVRQVPDHLPVEPETHVGRFRLAVHPRRHQDRTCVTAPVGLARAGQTRGDETAVHSAEAVELKPAVL